MVPEEDLEVGLEGEGRGYKADLRHPAGGNDLKLSEQLLRTFFFVLVGTRNLISAAQL